MKTSSMTSNLTLALAVVFLAGRASGQPVLTTLASFDASALNADSIFTNTLGSNPRGTLVLGSDGCFYGTTYTGGSNGVGTLFKVTTNGELTAVASLETSIAASAYAGLVLGKDGGFYGTSDAGGGGGSGTVFRLTTNGTLNTILSFDGVNGRHPNALTLGADDFLYGAAQYGGINSYGSLFKTGTNGIVGWAITLADDISFNDQSVYTNTFGGNPWAGLTLGNDGNYYGTASTFGANGSGTVFRVTTNGVLSVVAAFDARSFDFNIGRPTNVSGFNPYGGLTLGGDGSLFGTTDFGGTSGNGVIFQVTTNGTTTWLFSFPSGSMNNSSILTNLYGIQPNALTLGNDGNLYGTTRFGGLNGNGTVFRINLAPSRILITYPGFGVRTNQFGFTIIGTNGMVVVVEACTNLASSAWIPVGTNTINGVLSDFRDPQWTNSPHRFYRLHLP